MDTEDCVTDLFFSEYHRLGSYFRKHICQTARGWPEKTEAIPDTPNSKDFDTKNERIAFIAAGRLGAQAVRGK